MGMARSIRRGESRAAASPGRVRTNFESAQLEATMALVDVTCPMAGSIWKVHVSVGDGVTAGQEVLVLESMKMEIPIEAPAAGRVVAIEVAEGDKVNEGQLLLRIDGG